MRKLSAFLLLMILAHVARGQVSVDSGTTISPFQDSNWEAEKEDTTKTVVAEDLPATQASGSSGDLEIAATEGAHEVENENEQEPASNTETSNNGKESSTSSANVETSSKANGHLTESSSQSSVEPEATTVPADPICTTVGVWPHEQNCHQYYECTAEGSTDGVSRLITKSCEPKYAFNIELNRCSRDISSCPLAVNCTIKGSLVDPANDSAYYICDPRFDGLRFRIYHITCSSYESYFPILQKCAIDPTKLGNVVWEPIKDYDIVKTEMKILKKQDKLKFKQEEQLAKLTRKEAKRIAKAEEKLNKAKLKQEAASIVCVGEGSFPSQVVNNAYIVCVNKKLKWKAVPMKCGWATTFNPATSMCEPSVGNTISNTSADTSANTSADTSASI